MNGVDLIPHKISAEILVIYRRIRFYPSPRPTNSDYFAKLKGVLNEKSVGLIDALPQVQLLSARTEVGDFRGMLQRLESRKRDSAAERSCR